MYPLPLRMGKARGKEMIENDVIFLYGFICGAFGIYLLPYL